MTGQQNMEDVDPPNRLSGAPSARRVVVIGAGMAGLAAALALREAGFDVTVLEASNRPGGRVLTLREPFADGQYCEAGAMFVPAFHPLTIQYAEKAGCTLVPIAVPPARQFFVEGTRVFDGPGQAVEWPVALTVEERKLGFGALLAKYCAAGLKALGDPTAAGWPDADASALDRLTITEYLREQGASPAAIRLMSIGTFDFYGDGSGTASALSCLVYLYFSQRGQRFTIEGGMDRMPRALAAALDDCIRYGHTVKRLDCHATGIDVSYQRKAEAPHPPGHEQRREIPRNGLSDAHAREVEQEIPRDGLSGAHARGPQRGRDEPVEILQVDFVLCALPCAVLRDIVIEPAPPALRRRFIDGQRSTPVSRVMLQCRARPWAATEGYFAADTDLPIGRLMDGSPTQPGARGILMSFTTGPSARALSDRRAGNLVLSHATRLLPTLAADFELSAGHAWHDDPFAKGGYAWYAPGEMTDMLPSFSTPEGRVYFAGDHASLLPGWIQGALTSALAAVDQIKAASSLERTAH